MLEFIIFLFLMSCADQRQEAIANELKMKKRSKWKNSQQNKSQSRETQTHSFVTRSELIEQRSSATILNLTNQSSNSSSNLNGLCLQLQSVGKKCSSHSKQCLKLEFDRKGRERKQIKKKKKTEEKKKSLKGGRAEINVKTERDDN